MSGHGYTPEMIRDIFKIQEKAKKVTEKKSESERSILSDSNFEKNIREKISTKLSLERYNSKYIEEGKEFKFFNMEIFNSMSKALLTSCAFFDKGCLLEYGDDIFYISLDDISKLYYYNINTKNKLTINGFEETQQLSTDATNFYFTQDEANIINQAENQDLFFNDIKFNLLSNKTISFIGENNNIPENIIKNYYVKGKLISKGNNLFALSFGKDKEFNIGEGTIHYPMKNYYIKLTTIKGEFDGIYKSKNELKLSDFQCKQLLSQFNEIPKESIILFEFKNGTSGENGVIAQAIKYQRNAKMIYKGLQYYHIIIIRSKELGNKVANKISKELIENNKFNNFALLCMENNLSICGESIVTSNTKSTKNPKESNVSKDDSRIIQLQKDVNNMQNDMNSMKKDISDMKEQLSLILSKLNIQVEKINENNQNKK